MNDEQTLTSGMLNLRNHYHLEGNDDVYGGFKINQTFLIFDF